MKMIPGMGGIVRQIGDLSPAEKEMKTMRIMINSMTKSERQNHKLLNKSRRDRVVKGSGRSVQELDQFISRFEQMQKMMSGMMGMMGGGAAGGMMNPMNMLVEGGGQSWFSPKSWPGSKVGW